MFLEPLVSMNINRFCFHTGGLHIQEENSPAHKQDRYI